MRSIYLSVACALSATAIATPAFAQLRYEAKSPNECAQTAARAKRAIYEAQKLKVDQRFWSERYRRVPINDPRYISAIQALKSRSEQEQVRLGSSCQRHFSGNPNSWLLSWSYDDGYRYGSGQW